MVIWHGVQPKGGYRQHCCITSNEIPNRIHTIQRSVWGIAIPFARTLINKSSGITRNRFEVPISSPSLWLYARVEEAVHAERAPKMTHCWTKQRLAAGTGNTGFSGTSKSNGAICYGQGYVFCPGHRSTTYFAAVSLSNDKDIRHCGYVEL